MVLQVKTLEAAVSTAVSIFKNVVLGLSFYGNKEMLLFSSVIMTNSTEYSKVSNITWSTSDATLVLPKGFTINYTCFYK